MILLVLGNLPVFFYFQWHRFQFLSGMRMIYHCAFVFIVRICYQKVNLNISAGERHVHVSNPLLFPSFPAINIIFEMQKDVVPI